MDDDVRYADEILAYFKRYETGNTGSITSSVTSTLQYENLKLQMAFYRIFQYLEDEGFITKKQSVGRTEDLALTAKGRKILSLSSYLKEIEQQKEKERRKEEQDQAKYKLEIENLQLQIDTQKKWFWIAIVTAVIVEVVRIYFSWK